jgi:hypothetical protein
MLRAKKGRDTYGALYIFDVERERGKERKRGREGDIQREIESKRER